MMEWKTFCVVQYIHMSSYYLSHKMAAVQYYICYHNHNERSGKSPIDVNYIRIIIWY